VGDIRLGDMRWLRYAESQEGAQEGEIEPWCRVLRTSEREVHQKANNERGRQLGEGGEGGDKALR